MLGLAHLLLFILISFKSTWKKNSLALLSGFICIAVLVWTLLSAYSTARSLNLQPIGVEIVTLKWLKFEVLYCDSSIPWSVLTFWCNFLKDLSDDGEVVGRLDRPQGPPAAFVSGSDDLGPEERRQRRLSADRSSGILDLVSQDQLQQDLVELQWR